MTTDDETNGGAGLAAPESPEVPPGQLLPPGDAPRQSSVLRVLLGGACLFIIIFGLKYARDVVNPVLFAFVITLAVSPLLHWLIRRGLRTMWAFLVALIVTGVIGVLFALILAASLAQLAKEIPSYADSLEQMVNDAVSWLNGLGLDTGQIASRDFNAQAMVDWALGLIDDILGALSSVFTIALVFFFMLWDAAASSGKYSPSEQPMPVFARAERFTREVRGFLKVQVMLGALAAVVETVLLLALGVDFALMWGLISFLFSFIPYIGFMAALVPPMLLALITLGWQEALIVALGYVIINTLTDNLLKPAVMGKETNLTPLVVFLSLVLWGWVLGPVGALLSVPLTLIARTLFLEGYEESRWLAKLMGKEETEQDAGENGEGPTEGGRRRWLRRRGQTPSTPSS